MIKFIFKADSIQVRKKHMFSTNMLLLFFIVLGLGGPKNLQAQEQMSSQYAWFDSMIGPNNLGIFKGVAYNNEFRVISDRHQFFKKMNFIEGSVVFDQQSYFNLQLRYDVYNDNLQIINADVLGLPPIILDNNKVEAFQIGEYLFENIDHHVIKEDNLSGMVQVIVPNDSLTLYKKHHKKPLKKTDETRIYYEFKNSHRYYVWYKNRSYSVKKASDLTTIFPIYRKHLKRIHEKYVVLKKTNSDAYMKSVVSDLLVIIHQDNLEE